MWPRKNGLRPVLSDAKEVLETRLPASPKSFCRGVIFGGPSVILPKTALYGFRTKGPTVRPSMRTSSQAVWAYRGAHATPQIGVTPELRWALEGGGNPSQQKDLA